jgi:hypothetical protein
MARSHRRKGSVWGTDPSALPAIPLAGQHASEGTEWHDMFDAPKFIGSWPHAAEDFVRQLIATQAFQCFVSQVRELFASLLLLISSCFIYIYIYIYIYID